MQRERYKEMLCYAECGNWDREDSLECLAEIKRLWRVLDAVEEWARVAIAPPSASHMEGWPDHNAGLAIERIIKGEG